eukprot:3429635-Prymnesium_polylepis.1
MSDSVAAALDKDAFWEALADLVCGIGPSAVTLMSNVFASRIDKPGFVGRVLRVARRVRDLGLGFDPLRRVLCKENGRLMDKMEQFESAVATHTDA